MLFTEGPFSLSSTVKHRYLCFKALVSAFVVAAFSCVLKEGGGGVMKIGTPEE